MSCPRQRRRYALLGDSYAEGLAPYLGELADQCGDTLTADATRGSGAEFWTPQKVLARAGGAQVVALSIGGNDFGRAPGSTDAGAAAVARAVASAGKTLLWIPPLRLPFPDKARTREAWARAVPAHVKWDQIYFPERADDGVHLTPAGYRTWARAIWAWIARRERAQLAAGATLPSMALAALVVAAFAFRDRAARR